MANKVARLAGNIANIVKRVDSLPSTRFSNTEQKIEGVIYQLKNPARRLVLLPALNISTDPKDNNLSDLFTI